MAEKQSLTLRQKLYSHWRALGLSPEEAAAQLEFRPAEAAAAEAAWKTAAGRRYAGQITRQLAGRPPTALEGYSRLAFGDVSEAAGLVFCGEEPPAGRLPDLFNVSEIRRSKNGVELRFFDRMEALDRLLQLEAAAKGDGPGLYDAIASCAQTIKGEKDGG